MTDIDILKAKNISDRDIEMFKMRMEGTPFKQIAAKFNLKNGVSVSRRVKKIQTLLKGIDRGIKSGNIVLKNAGTQIQTSKHATGVGVALPDNNPFLALNTFEDLAGISSAGGAVIGAGAATLFQAFQREDLPYGERQMLAMKGASVLGSSILSLYLTFNKFSQMPEMKEVSEIEKVE